VPSNRTLRLVVVPTSPRVAAGQLTWPAWEALRSGVPVATADLASPHAAAVAAAGVALHARDPAIPGELAALAGVGGAVAWLGGEPAGDAELVDGLRATTGGGLQVEVVPGCVDLPGAHLLDAVAVMDRLRSPGGCPWDAEQTHRSLLPYLLEEAYEAAQAIEDGDTGGLCEELGDVLLQVLFHARLAAEQTPPWTVDDVADGLVTKLVGRHPHVFADARVTDAAHVVLRWEELKAAEKQRLSVTDGVPLSMAALALAAKLRRRAAKVGVPTDLLTARELPGGSGLGGDLWRIVGTATAPGGTADGEDRVEAEAALRAVCRAFRDRLAAAETAARAEGREPASLTGDEWRARW